MYINQVHAKCKVCDTLRWGLWSNCVHGLTCGEGRFRQIGLCCFENLKPFTLENFLNHFNLTKIWLWSNSYEQDTCETSCIHGPYSDTYRRCKCTTGKYRYSCETGKILFFRTLSINVKVQISSHLQKKHNILKLINNDGV